MMFTSPFPWLGSPICDLEAMSPHSTLSFSLSSPPRPTISKCSNMSPCQEGIAEMLAATFSPSIFSPDDKASAKAYKDTHFTNVTGFPLFSDLNSPPASIHDRVVTDLRAHIEIDGCEANSKLGRKNGKKGFAKKEQLLPSGCKSLTPIDEDLDIALPQEVSKKTGVVKQLTLKSKKLSKNLVVTPESTVVPPMLSPDVESSRRLSMDSSVGGVELGISHDSDSGSTIPVLSSSRGKGLKIFLSNPGCSPSKTTCNCKKSKCLKLYCDCFAVLNYCDPNTCNCVQCHNVAEHEDTRTEAIRITKERNNLAFKTKISEQEQHHVTGCHCKNSHCLKKYCECFNGGALCGTNCKCQACQNYSGSLELAKTRENSPKLDNIISKKRKESPNSVSWLSNSPELSVNHDVSKISSVNSNMKEDKKSHYALRGNGKVLEVSVDVKKDFSKSQSKKRKVTFVEPELTYPFFGPTLPEAPKRVALLVLDCLSGKDIYAMSQVNGIWCDAARDDALWE